MSEEAIYDEGYHDGIKDVVNVFLLMHMDGSSLPEIRERIVNMRKNAKLELDRSRDRAGQDEEWDDED